MNSILKHYNIPLILRAVRELGNKKGAYLVYMFGMFAVEACFITLPSFGIKGAVNSVISGDISSFLTSTLLIASGYMLWWINAPVSSYFSAKITKGRVCGIKTELCSHIIRLPMTIHDKKPAGELLSSLSNDCACFEEIYRNYLYKVLSSISGGVCGVVVMAVIDWRFSIVVFVLGTVSVLISAYFTGKLEAAGKEYSERLAKTSTDAYELVRAAKTIRVLGLQGWQRRLFNEKAECETAVKMKIGRLDARMKASAKLADAIIYLAILFTGAVFVRRGLADWGGVMALIALKTSTDMLFVECGQHMAELQVKLAGVKRVYNITDLPEEEPEHYTGRCEAVLEMRNVSFAYEGRKDLSENKEFVIKDFNLKLAPCTLTVLAGVSGSGKSSVMKLLLGLYEPDKGEILSRSGGRLREMCAYVPQEAMLFRGTVYDNIAFGRPEAGDMEVYTAAKLAGATEFISTLPEGMNTQLLDCGASLSGGQKQRLAIARAILRDSPVLLLDEITSALDSETEMKIFETVRELAKTKTVLFITHNNELVKLADNIVMM